MNLHAQRLYEIVDEWRERMSAYRDLVALSGALVDELLFHAELRFEDYIQFNHVPYPARLVEFIKNSADAREQHALLELAAELFFVDKDQLVSLHREAFRSIVVPWLERGELSRERLLSPRRRSDLIAGFSSCFVASVTESFGIGEFLHANDLSGVPRPLVLGTRKRQIDLARAELIESGKQRAIFFEDFSGTGDQIGRSLVNLLQADCSHLDVLVVPLIALRSGVNKLRNRMSGLPVTVNAALEIPDESCLSVTGNASDPEGLARRRALVRRTGDRVLQRLDDHDDPPNDPFGYKSSGCMIVTAYNTPNNTLPLVHHRAPNWKPLFRRVHHGSGT